jgi:hypothetical protein
LVGMQGFFKLLEERKAELGVSDLQLGLTTLEEVFLTISRQADLENAAAEGRFEKLTVNGVTLKVRSSTFWNLPHHA